MGYANKDGNLIVKEQWLEKPVWDIYILLDCNESEHIAGLLQNRNCVYFPYLGKNDHPADIKDVKRLALRNITDKEIVISSLFLKNTGEMAELDEDDDTGIVRYCEKLPVALNAYTNLYEYDDFCYTNVPVIVKNGELYKCENDILQFF